MTSYAQCAKAIRKELKMKFPSIKFSVTSSGYSMGDSVSISYENGIPESEVEKVTNKYQYGSFDGMIDLYSNTNNRDDIPQSKWVQVSRHISQDVRDTAKKEIAVKFGITNPDDEKEWHLKRGMWSDQAVWKEIQSVTL